jgi:hypothetical protein
MKDVPVKIDTPGAVARQKTDFGDCSGYSKMGAEHFTFAAGTDIAPLLQGLDGDMCQCPHWGYVVKGEVTATYADKSEETVITGDLFYWPEGHSVRASQDSEIILFSPQHEHGQVMDHILNKLNS